MAATPSGLPQMTAAQQGKIDTARTNKAPVVATGNTPNTAEKAEYWREVNNQTVQPNVSQSALRPMTVSEAAKINTARTEAGVNAQTQPQMMPNPNPAASEAPAAPTAPAPAGPQTDVAPTQPQTNPQLNTPEREAIRAATGAQTDTLGGQWNITEEAYKGIAGTQYNADQYRGGDINQQPGMMQNGAEGMGTQRTTTGIGFDAGLSAPGEIPNQPGAVTPGAQTETQAAAANKTPADRLMGSDTPAPSPMVQSAGSKATEDILLDPVSSTQMKPGEDPYTANVRQLSELLMDGQLKKDQSIDRVISMMEKRKESMEAGMKESEDRILRDAKDLKERIAHERESASAQTKYELERGTRDREKNIDQMEQDNSRLYGFMQRRLAKMGNTDSSYAVAQISKYTSMATSQLSDARVELSDYRGMMVSKEQEIAYKFGNQLIDITNKSNDAIQQGRRQTYDQLLDIDTQITTSEIQKQDSRMQLLTQLTEMENNARSTAFQESQSVKAQALQEAQFAWGQLNDLKSQEQWKLGFDEQVRQYDKGQTFAEDQYRTAETGNLYFGGKEAIDPVTKKPIRALTGKTYDQQIDQWLTESSGFLYRNGGNTGAATWARDSFMKNFDRGIVESDRNYELNRNADLRAASSQELQSEKARIDMAIQKVNAGISSPAELNQFKSAFDVMASGTYVKTGGGGQKTIGDVVAKAMGDAAKNIGNSNYQCVQFVRSMFPDLPSGLFSLQDKIQNLVKSKNGLPASAMPQAGDVVVLDWKTKSQAGLSASQYPAHVATVGAIDMENQKMMIVQHNVPAGKTSSQWIDMKNGDIEGYWRSPNVSQQASPQMDQINRVTAGMPEARRETYQQVLANQLKSGDMQGFASTIQKAAYDTLPTEMRSKFDNAGLFASQFSDAQRKLESFKGGLDKSNPGMWNKLFESSKTLGQLQQDKEYQSVVQSVMLPSLQMANDLFGAAQSVPELKRATSAIPNAESMTFKDMANLSRGLEEYYRRQQGAIISNAANVRPPLNARGMIDTPYGEVSPDEYDAMSLMSQ